MRRFSRCRRLASGACALAAASALLLAAPADTLLVRAIRAKNAAGVRAALKQRVDVNAPQGDGTTPLHWAVHVDDLAIADILIRAGARANAANDNGFTPLHLACTNRSSAMVERLLAAGANANSTSLNGETVLMTCARAGDAKGVKALLVHGARVNEKEKAHDQTALMWAASQSHPDVVRVLTEAGADVNARSRAFPQTVVGEQTQRAGREELNYTVMRGGSTPLLFTARVGDPESARVLLAAGANANDSLPDGTSALVLAAHSGHGDVGDVLLDKGADPNAFGTGYTALHAAALKSDVKLVKALLAHGANPNIRMTKGTPVRRDTTDFNLPAPLIGSTPYLLAARFLEPEIMRALAAGGADVKATMPNGATAVMLASGMGSSPNSDRRGIATIDFGKVEPESEVLAAVQIAVELDGDVNAANQAGDTALHAAAQLGHNTVIQFLVERGAQVNAKNKRGQTALGQLLSGGRGRGAAAAGADLTGIDAPPREIPFPATASLLRKLGASE
jgi:uncharacterized protein